MNTTEEIKKNLLSIQDELLSVYTKFFFYELLAKFKVLSIGAALSSA